MLDVETRIKLVCERENLEKQIDEASIKSLYAASIASWDHTHDRSVLDPPNFGMWRTPHLLTSCRFSEIDPSRPPVLHAEMSKEELYIGYWRVSRILPEAQYTYIDDDFVKVDPGDIYSTVKRRNKEYRPLADRDWLIFSVFGHTIRDAIDFLHDALNKEPEIGRMLLSKRFEEALVKHPEVLEWEWPKETQRRWRATGGKDYLPPFIFLTLLAEFQRLAQNSTALISMSFRRSGSKLTISSAVNDLKAANPDYVGKSSNILDSSLASLISFIPLQTYALLPNENIIRDKLALEGISYTEKAFCILNKAILTGPKNILKELSGLSNQSRSAFIAQTMIAHADNRADRKVRGGKYAIRTESLPKCYGNDWHEYALVGLFQLVSAAKSFNREYRKTRLPQCIPSNQSNIINQKQAIDRIVYAWLETTHQQAYEQLSMELEVDKARRNNNKDTAEEFGLDEKYSEQSAVAAKKSAGQLLRESVEPAEPIVELRETKINERLILNMEKRAKKKRAAGMPGFTADYNPSLWFKPDKKCNDIGFWIGRRIAAQKFKIANLESAPLSIEKEILSDIDRYRDTPSTIEDRAAQNLAMTISEFSLDPMHAFSKRKNKSPPSEPRRQSKQF